MLCACSEGAAALRASAGAGALRAWVPIRLGEKSVQSVRVQREMDGCVTTTGLTVRENEMRECDSDSVTNYAACTVVYNDYVSH